MKPETGSGQPPDRADVIAHPPVLYGGFLMIGAIMDRLVPLVVLPDSLNPAGWVLVIFSFAIGLAAVFRFVSRGISVPTHTPTSGLVTDGLYRYSRNPIYLALTLIYIGTSLIAGWFWPLLLLLPLLPLMHYGVIRREEDYLNAKFGTEYQAYRKAVRRYL
ncbi:MAG: isoprenylcysteine carboxylmethyltransferase family protein [Rhodospirillales bacterium]